MFDYFWAYISFSVILYLLEQWLELRQLAKDRQTKIPANVVEMKLGKDEKKFAESQAYSAEKRRFGLFKGALDFSISILFLSFAKPTFWRWAMDVAKGQEERIGGQSEAYSSYY